MKISEGKGPSALPTPQKNINKPGPREGSFQKIMDQMNLQTETKEDFGTAREVGPIPDGIQFLRDKGKVDERSNVPEKEQILRELQQTMDLVDFYAGKLSDTSLPLKGLDPLMSHLEDRLETLRSMEKGTGLPERLRPIISDMLITIGTEIAKFRRGDYS